MFRRYRNYHPGEFIICFADTAAGLGDYCAAQFLSKSFLDFPLVYHSKTIATEMTPQLHLELERIYDATGVKPVVAYERNNGGLFEMDRMASLNKLDKYTLYRQKLGEGTINQETSSPKLGWDTTTATRPKMLGDWKQAIDQKLVKLYDRPTVNEHFSFVVVQTTSTWKAQAERGAHDDLVMACAGAWQLYQTEQPVKTLPVDMPAVEDLFDAGGFYGVGNPMMEEL